MTTAVLLFAIAALGGIVMAIMRLGGRELRTVCRIWADRADRGSYQIWLFYSDGHCFTGIPGRGGRRLLPLLFTPEEASSAYPLCDSPRSIRRDLFHNSARRRLRSSPMR
jgi:hypothetical protein